MFLKDKKEEQLYMRYICHYIIKICTTPSFTNIIIIDHSHYQYKYLERAQKSHCNF